MLGLLLLALIAGFLVKLVDWLDDDAKSRHPVKFLFALIYGAIIGYLISVASFGMLFLAALVGQVFARKVDTLAHRVGFLVAALSMLCLGIPVFDALPFVVFLVAAFLDEADYVGKLRPLNDWRPFLKLTPLLFVVVGRWDYFAGIIAFDIGYEASLRLARKFGR